MNPDDTVTATAGLTVDTAGPATPGVTAAAMPGAGITVATPAEAPADPPINLPDVLAEVTAVFARYEDALVTNRLDVLDELFWPSAHTVRYGVGETLVGIDAIRAFRAARPAAGLARTLVRTVITTYGRDTATAMTEFVRDASPDKVGRQSQTWVRFAAGWRVVAAHVSVIARP